MSSLPSIALYRLMLIRQANPEEASRLSEVALASKRSWGYSTEDLKRWGPQLTIVAKDIAANPTCIAEVNAQVVGFYMLVSQGATCALEHLWVVPGYMRCGIGGALLRHAIANATAAGFTEISIDADPNAEHFYLSHGAFRVGTEAGPVASDQDRVRPQLRIAMQSKQ